MIHTYRPVFFPGGIVSNCFWQAEFDKAVKNRSPKAVPPKAAPPKAAPPGVVPPKAPKQIPLIRLGPPGPKQPQTEHRKFVVKVAKKPAAKQAPTKAEPKREEGGARKREATASAAATEDGDEKGDFLEFRLGHFGDFQFQH